MRPMILISPGFKLHICAAIVCLKQHSLVYQQQSAGCDLIRLEVDVLLVMIVSGKFLMTTLEAGCRSDPLLFILAIKNP